jgi:acetyl-CoA carboxylase biotin carboxyl carrier protein
MDLNQLKQILDLVREHELSEIELEHEGLKLKVRTGRGVGHQVPAPAVLPAAAVHGSAVPAAPAATALASGSPTAAPAGSAPAAEDEIELAVVKSPIVGTFYGSPEPNAAAFVQVGTTVKKGQVLCIIEAMKLMNEIDSEYDGEIANVYVENGQAVQYGERLFAIRTR